MLWSGSVLFSSLIMIHALNTELLHFSGLIMFHALNTELLHFSSLIMIHALNTELLHFSGLIMIHALNTELLHLLCNRQGDQQLLFCGLLVAQHDALAFRV